MSDKLKECRAAFEKWAIDEYGYDPSFHFKSSELCNDKYYHVVVQGDWEIWQAAWNTRPTQQPTAGAYVAKAEIEKLLHMFVELGFI